MKTPRLKLRCSGHEWVASYQLHDPSSEDFKTIEVAHAPLPALALDKLAIKLSELSLVEITPIPSGWVAAGKYKRLEGILAHGASPHEALINLHRSALLNFVNKEM